MRYFMIAMGVIVSMTFLLAILGGAVQAGAGDSAPVAAPATENVEPMDGAPLILLALAGGTALLAGVVWLEMLRRTHMPISE
jgi:Na+/H+ antiporter NhaC